MECDAWAFTPVFYVVGTIRDYKIALAFFDIEFPAAKHYG